MQSTISLNKKFLVRLLLTISFIIGAFLTFSNKNSTRVYAACDNTECAQGEISVWACGTGGCGSGQRRYCPCQPPGTVGFFWCWGGCYCQDDLSCGGGGTACTPNATRCSAGCGTNGCAQCLPDGSGEQCVPESVCGSCGGGGGGCTPVAPARFDLISPLHGTNYQGNDVYLDWRNVSNWGVGCPTTTNVYRARYTIKPPTNRPTDPCPAQGDASYTSPGTTPISNYQLNNLNWGTTYCWYAQALNGSVSSTSRQTWEFTTPKTIVIDNSSITSAMSCGGNISGSANISGTDNPITFYSQYTLNDNGVGVSGIDQIALAIVPSAYSSASIVSEAVTSNIAKDYFMAIVDVNSNNPSQSQFRIVNKNGATGLYSNPQATGNLTNSAGTATLMNINNSSNPNYTHIEIVNANTLRIYWQVRFEDNYKYQQDGSLFASVINNNIYTAAFREYLPGQWNSSTGSATIERSLRNRMPWGVNVQIPQVEIGEPTIISDTDFSINWGTTAYGLQKAEGYMWTQNQPLQVNKLSPTPTGLITLSTTEPNTNIRPVPNSNVNAYFRTGLASKLGTHTYRLTSATEVTDVINTKMYAEDTACNYTVDSGNALNLTGRWMLTTFGNVFAPNFSFTVNQANVAPSIYSYVNTYSYLSTYIASTLQKPITTGARQSKTSFTLEDYNDWNGKVPKTDNSTNWYDYLYKVVGSNAQIKPTSSASINTGTTTSSFLAQFGAGYTGHVVTAGNFTIQSNAICNTQTIFFINGNLSITPDFTIQNAGTTKNGCMFIVKGNVTIQNGASLGYYDRIDGFYIVNGTFATLTDRDYTGTVYDGLYIKGSVIATNTSFQRTFHLLKNISYPAEIIEYDPRFSNIFENALAIKEYSIREKGYIERTNR